MLSADSFLNEGSQMNVPRIDVVGASAAGSGWSWPWNRASRDEARKWRLERDTERGYSINVKQVMLAFAVEFVIIGLILANQSAIAASLPNATWLSFIMGTSMPVALAMAELAACTSGYLCQNSTFLEYKTFGRWRSYGGRSRN